MIFIFNGKETAMQQTTDCYGRIILFSEPYQSPETKSHQKGDFILLLRTQAVTIRNLMAKQLNDYHHPLNVSSLKGVQAQAAYQSLCNCLSGSIIPQPEPTPQNKEGEAGDKPPADLEEVLTTVLDMVLLTILAELEKK